MYFFRVVCCEEGRPQRRPPPPFLPPCLTSLFAAMIASMSKSSSSNKACFQSRSSCPLLGLLLVDHCTVGLLLLLRLRAKEGRIEVVLPLQLLLLGLPDGRTTKASTPAGNKEEEKRRRVVVVVKRRVAAAAARAVEALATAAAPPRRCRVARMILTERMDTRNRACLCFGV